MDREFLEQIKEITNKHSLPKGQNLYFSLCDIDKKIEGLISALYKIKHEYVTNSITYVHQYSLSKVIEDLGQIILMFMNEQNKTAEFTKDALNNKDDSKYFKNKIREKNNFKIVPNISLNEELMKAINNRKNYYIESFGYFVSKDSADAVIKKEFDDISLYLGFLLEFNKLKYEDIDNFDILINLCQNLMYEISQLFAAFAKADESNINYIIEEDTKFDLPCYFILMDFVNSCSFYPNRLWELVDSIEKLNYIIKRRKDMGLLCNLKTYKQDEVSGLYIGEINDFINVVESNLPYDIKLAYAPVNLEREEKGLIDINESVYNIPFILSGPSAWEARKRYTNDPILIKSKAV